MITLDVMVPRLRHAVGQGIQLWAPHWKTPNFRSFFFFLAQILIILLSCIIFCPQTIFMSLNIKSRAFFFVAICFVGVSSLRAQSGNTKQVHSNVAVINSYSFQSPTEGIIKLAGLQKQVQTEFQAKQKELEEMQQRLQTLSNQIKSASGNVDPKKIEQAENLQRDLRKLSDNYNQQSQKRYDDLFQPLNTKMGALLKQWCQQRGYTVLLDLAKDDKGILMWADEKNITTTTADLIGFINSAL